MGGTGETCGHRLVRSGGVDAVCQFGFIDRLSLHVNTRSQPRQRYLAIGGSLGDIETGGCRRNARCGSYDCERSRFRTAVGVFSRCGVDIRGFARKRLGEGQCLVGSGVVEYLDGRPVTLKRDLERGRELSSLRVESRGRHRDRHPEIAVVGGRDSRSCGKRDYRSLGQKYVVDIERAEVG